MSDGFVVPAKEASWFLGVSRSTLLRRAANGFIEGVRRGKGKTAPMFFRRQDLLQMADNPPRRGRRPKPKPAETESSDALDLVRQDVCPSPAA